MTDIATVLSDLSTESVKLQSDVAAASAQGTKAAAVVAVTRVAATAVQSLSISTQSRVAQIAADGAKVTAALAARNTALAAANTARTQGPNPPLSDAEANALKTATATANGVSEADLDSKGVAAVTGLDGAIDDLGHTEHGDLQTAQADLATKQTALSAARDTAMTRLTQILGSAADLTARLNGAQANRLKAQQLNAATDTASHRAAVVAYADYVTARTALSDAETADPDGTVAQTQWTAAANAWLSALADVVAAEEQVIEKQLALDSKLAEQAARQQTRDADAIAAVTAAIP